MAEDYLSLDAQEQGDILRTAPIMTSVWTVGCASFPTTTNSRACDPTMRPCAPLASSAPRRRISTC